MALFMVYIRDYMMMIITVAPGHGYGRDQYSCPFADHICDIKV